MYSPMGVLTADTMTISLIFTNLLCSKFFSSFHEMMNPVITLATPVNVRLTNDVACGTSLTNGHTMLKQAMPPKNGLHEQITHIVEKKGEVQFLF